MLRKVHKINGCLTLVFFLLQLLPAKAQTADPGASGIWLLMDINSGTKNTYTIYKKSGSEDWTLAGKLLPPRSESEISARLFDVEAMNLVTPPRPNEKQVARLWRMVAKNAPADSFISIRQHYAALYACGFAWYDVSVKAGVKYAYKIVKNESGGSAESKILDPVSAPGIGPEVNFVLKEVKNTKGANTMDFEIGNVRDIVLVQVYRSYYQRTGYEKINPDIFFTKTKEGYRLTVSDVTAADRVPYSYYLVPFDAAGNAGHKSAEIKMYSTPQNTIPPSVTSLKTYSKNADNAIRLAWKLSDISKVVSIDIYKSQEYDGKYYKIASTGPSDTQYIDYEVKPVATYYYTIVLNGMYESSPTSPRVSGMLEAVGKNYLPPQMVQVEMKGSYPVISWNRTEFDTRAYYIWRGMGSPADMKKITEVISDSATVSYTDTVPEPDEDVRIFYAVSDLNTSYEEGPRSEFATCVIKGAKSLLPPDTIGVYALRDGKVFVTWKAVGLKLGRVQGYNLYRYYTAENGTEEEGSLVKLNKQMLDYRFNQFTDSSMSAGKRCVYFVRSVGDTPEELSVKSPEAVYHAPGVTGLLNVSQFDGFPQTGAVRLNWNNPLGDKLTGVEIWRSDKEGKPVLIKKLDGKTETFTDSGLKSGNTVFYYIRCVYGTAFSPFSDPLGVTPQ